LNTGMMKSKWLPEEDKILEAAVRMYGEKNWQQIASHLNGRTGQQCLHRYQKTLNPAIRRGTWDFEEDRRLLLAVRAYGNKNWIKVQQHVVGRTDVQCRERWVNVLNPELKSGPWSDGEDQRLKIAVIEKGAGKWSEISKFVGHRTDNQCWRRWKFLNADALPHYRLTIMKRRKSLVNNFVGREKERSNLTPEDFENPDELLEEPKAKNVN